MYNMKMGKKSGCYFYCYDDQQWILLYYGNYREVEELGYVTLVSPHMPTQIDFTNELTRLFHKVCDKADYERG